jgi:hypothetical protein
MGSQRLPPTEAIPRIRRIPALAGENVPTSIECGGFEGAGVDLTNTAGSLAEDRFSGKRREREPDQNESNQMPAGEWFVIKKNAEEEGTDRRKVMRPEVSWDFLEPSDEIAIDERYRV